MERVLKTPLPGAVIPPPPGVPAVDAGGYRPTARVDPRPLESTAHRRRQCGRAQLETETKVSEMNGGLNSPYIPEYP